MKTHLIKIQLALFFEKPTLRPDLFIGTINSKLNNIFDVMPTILPLSEDAPEDAPIVQLDSTKENYKVNIAKSRADLFFNGNLKNKINDIKEIENEIILKLNKFVEAIFETMDNNIIRIGVVAQYFIDDNNSVNTLLNSYIKKELKNTKEVNLRFNQQNKICNLKVNDIINLETVKGKINNNEKIGFIIERDINNIPMKKIYLNKETLKEFIKSSIESYSKDKIEELI